MMQVFWLLLGLAAAILFIRFARERGEDQEQKVLATGLLVAALIYVGFAILWGNWRWITLEVGGVLLFGLVAYLARRSLVVLLAVGWASHALWDILLHWLGPGYTVAPAWYVWLCFSFDLVVAAYLLVRRGAHGHTGEQDLSSRMSLWRIQ